MSSSLASLGSTVANGVVGVATTLCTSAKSLVICSGRTFVSNVHVPASNAIATVFARANALTGFSPYTGIVAAVATTVAIGVLANRLWLHKGEANASPVAMTAIRAAGVIFAAAAGSAAAATFIATVGGPVMVSYALGATVFLTCFFAGSDLKAPSASKTSSAASATAGQTARSPNGTPSRSASASASSLTSGAPSASTQPYTVTAVSPLPFTASTSTTVVAGPLPTVASAAALPPASSASVAAAAKSV